ncbi:MAG: ribonuclease R [Brumimicrobium sp.]|nr:ribonuclease R [Brumimicrobium sp.]
MSKHKINKKGLEVAIRKIFESHPDQQYNSTHISAILQIKDKNLRKLILSILNDLKKDGFLNEFQRGEFILNEGFTTVYQGTVDATPRGTAYIIVPELEGDIYVSKECTNHALQGDLVEVQVIKKKKGKIEGVITKIIERKITLFVGTLDIHKNFAFLISDDRKINVDIFIPLKKLKEGKHGQKAIARITSWPKDMDNPYGEIVELLGEAGDNNTEMLSILAKKQFDSGFPKEVTEIAEKISVELDQDEVKKRRDYRDEITLTIDPVDAKDFDDALSFKKLDNGNYEIGVHIADVSFYVQPNSPIDVEALKRGNSVYLEDRVIPMLPEEISNLACSLRPNEDKFAFSAIFEIGQDGKIHNQWFGKTVICSNHRFSYEEAQEIIEGKKDEYSEVILTLHHIAQAYRKERIQNGALAIESEELRFVLDENGNPIEVKRRIMKEANKLIEEFMLLANKRVALYVGKLNNDKGYNKEFIYRCHDKPDIEKLNTFSIFIDKFNYSLALKDVDSAAKKINQLLDKIRDTPEYDLIQNMAIRSMAKAVYQTNNIGHYGLAFDFYTHFTSPIRRYADLMVHRILLDKLNNVNKSYGNRLNEICKHISNQEKKAIEAERESNKFFQAKYLLDKVGQVFEGTISGLTDHGIYVKIVENNCEGMVRMNDLPDDTYYFDQNKFQITGRHTKYTYNFGDKVLVKVNKVDLFKKEIDMKIVG